MIIILLSAWLIFQGIMEVFNWWELCFRKFVRSGHVGIGIDAICKDLSQKFGGVSKFIATTFQKRRHEVVQRRGEKLEIVYKT